MREKPTTRTLYSYAQKQFNQSYFAKPYYTYGNKSHAIEHKTYPKFLLHQYCMNHGNSSISK
jgi:hypothetical protein